MIVQCPGCNSRYRVREEKLPTGGGNIECPSCHSVFPAAPASRVAAPRNTIPGSGPKATATNAPPPVPSSTESGATVLIEPGQSGGSTTWKIRTPVGLVYDFPNLAALKNWLSTRDSVSDMVASTDEGTTWQTLTAFDQLKGSLPKGRRSKKGAEPPVLSKKEGLAEAMDAVLSNRKSTEIPGIQPPSSTAGPKRPDPKTLLEKPRRTGTPARPASRGPAQKNRPPTKPQFKRIRSAPAQEGSGFGAFVGVLLFGAIVFGVTAHFAGIDVLDQLGIVNNDAPLIDDRPRNTAPQPSEALPPIDEVEWVVVDDPYAPNQVNRQQSPLGSNAADSIELLQQGVSPTDVRVASLIREAQLKIQEEDYDQAAQLLGSASHRAPSNPEPVCLLAAVNRAQGRIVEAQTLEGRCTELRNAQQQTAAQQN